jgi:hypothetical protein
VTPNCYQVAEIFRFFKNVKDCIDLTKKFCFEELKKIWNKDPYADLETVAMEKFLAEQQSEKAWLAKILGLKEIESGISPK